MKEERSSHVTTRLTSPRNRLTSWRRRSVILLIAGIVLGQMTYHVITSLLLRGRYTYCEFPSSPLTKREDSISDAQSNSAASLEELLFVGVMTSRRYLRTRARAIFETWGSVLNGSLLFFVGEGDEVEENLPVQILDGVTDSDYPPQRKSFAMLEFMHRNFGRKYEWFMRADDDLFVDVRRLRTLLSSINSSKPVYLGHPGTGKPEEAGRLGLPVGTPYCMGGTGVVLSRSILPSLAGRLRKCLQNTASNHEDSELGRCVYNSTGISCVQSQKIYRRFKQNYDDTSGEWIKKALSSSRPYVTFHPVKDTRYMYYGAALVESQRVSELQSKVRQLAASANCMEELLAPHEADLDENGPTGALCLHGNCSTKAAPQCEFGEGKRRVVAQYDMYSDNPWFLIHDNTFYTPWKNDLRKPAKNGGVSEGLTKSLRHLSNYITTRGRHPRQSKLVALDNFYRRVVPGVGVEYVMFIRDASSNVRPYVIGEAFDELIIVEKQ